MASSGLGRSAGNWMPQQQVQETARRGIAFRQFSSPPGYTFAHEGQPGASFGYGSGARSNRRAHSPGRTAERQERARQRSGSQQPQPEVFRMSPSGPEEARDWSHLLDQLQNNIATLERESRAQAQAMAVIENRVVDLNQRLIDVTHKAETTEIHLGQACTKIVEKYCTVDVVNDRTNAIAQEFSLVAARVAAIEAQVSEFIQDHFFRQKAPEPTQPRFDGADRPVPQDQDDEFEEDWDTKVNQGGSPFTAQADAPSAAPRGAGVFGPQAAQDEREQRQRAPEPSGFHPQRSPQQGYPYAEPPPSVPQPGNQGYHQDDQRHFTRIPPSWNGGNQNQAYEQCPFQTPPVRPNQYQANVPNQGVQQRPYGGAHPDAGLMGNQDAMNRKSESLFKFTGEAKDYDHWSKKFMDHLAKVHLAWRPTLEWVATSTDNLSMFRLRADTVGPYRENAADVASKLEQLIVDYLPIKYYNQRKQLCGGRMEEGNGFNMWRRLYIDNKGSSDIVDYAGIEVLREYPQCQSIKEVSNHMDNWKEMLGIYGSELQHCPRLLKSQLLSIIPKELKTEVLRERSLINAGYDEIIVWIKNRATILQQENLAIITKHNLAAHIKGKIQSLSPEGGRDEIPEDYVDAPSWAKHLIAAVSKVSPQVPSPPEPIDAVRPSRSQDARGRDPNRRRETKREGSNGSRRNSPSGGKPTDRRRSPSTGRRGARLVGWDNRCYHCGSKEHRRPDCAEFAKMMKESNVGKPKTEWKPPKGYKSALAKARDAEKSKVKKGAVTDIHEADDSASDDDDSYSEVGRSFDIVPVRALTPFKQVTRGTSWSDARVKTSSTAGKLCAVNKYKSLELDEDQEYDPDVLNSLSNWASRVHVGTKSSQKNKKSQSSTTQTSDRLSVPTGPTNLTEVREENRRIQEHQDRERPIFRLRDSDCTEKIANWVKSQKKPVDEVVIVRTPKDCDKLESVIAALPQDKKGLIKAAKKIESIVLGPNEMLVMIDSGSFIHAINAEESLPDHPIIPAKAGEKPLIAETACGGKLKKNGTVRVNCEIDNTEAKIEFDNIGVKTPILSVRRLIKDGHEVRFKKHNCYIKNLTTGKRINFFEYQGVYYLKMKVKPPTEPGFARQGA